VTYDEFISNVVQGVEAVGAGIMIVGGIRADQVSSPSARSGSHVRGVPAAPS
jgi:hypothetical protein